MSEMTPDAFIEKLTRFMPLSTAANQSALLFAAGQASARTPLGWKVAVVGLLLANFGWLSVLTLHSNARIEPLSAPQPDTMPSVTPQVEPAHPPVNDTPSTSNDPWSYRALLSAGYPETIPQVKPSYDPITTEKPLTPRMIYRGEIE